MVIPVLRKIKAGQSIREDGPKAHQTKAGTPTMGGLMIILAVIITCISMTVRRGVGSEMGILLVSFVLCGLIGFCDDFIKVVKKRNLGLTALQKLIFQIVIAVILAVYQSKVSSFGTSIYVPVVKDYIDLGWLYIPFVAFVLVAMVNAVNLTDGLDGLASGCTAVVALFLAITGAGIGYTSSSIFSAAYRRCMFRIPPVQSLPGESLYGRYGFTGFGRRSGWSSGHDEYRTDSSYRWRNFCCGSRIRHHSGGQLQDERQESVSNGSPPPSF